jgi:hypothetical protein
VWIVAGLALFVVVLCGAREGWAGSLFSSSITISGGIVQGPGDPPYIYEMDAYLVNASMSYPGTGPATTFFTVHGLTGVTPAGFPLGSDTGSLTTHSDSPPGALWTPRIELTSSASPYESDVSWSYVGHSTLSTSTMLLLGHFTVETSQSFPAGQPPIPVGSMITYTYAIYDSSGAPHTGSGTFILQQGIPEPPSILLLLAGGGALPLAIFGERRLRTGQAAARFACFSGRRRPGCS